MTEESIKLEQAKNQAIQIIKLAFSNDSLIKIMDKSNCTEFETAYKSLVKRFYKVNEEIDNEVLKPEIPFKKIIEAKKPSDKQKYCPKCNDIIPKTWKKHLKCGWEE